MTKLRTWLLHNTVLKFVSVLFALIIWLLVADNSNPEIYDTVNADLLSKNAYSFLSSDQVYTLSAEKVEISYKVRSNYQEKIKPSDFKAFIDFSELTETAGMYTLPVHIDAAPSAESRVSDLKADPSYINIYTEKIQQKKFAVNCTMSGNVGTGYVEGEIELSPEYVYVKGPVSLIGQISSIGISIDLDDITADQTGTQQIAFYDANGNELPELTTKLSYAGDISYHVPVFRTKSLSISAFAGGMPGTGYTVESVETSPTFISVYGPEEILNKHSYILIPGSDLSVAGITENMTKNIDISKYIPEGLTPVQNNHEITVYVKMRNAFEHIEDETKPEAETGKPVDAETSRPTAESTAALPETETAEKSSETESPVLENSETGSSADTETENASPEESGEETPEGTEAESTEQPVSEGEESHAED